MSAPHTIRIALAGFGTVGQGVWKHIETNQTALEARLGVRLELVRAAVRDPAKPRDLQLPAEKLTTDVLGLADDPEVDIICELMGGEGLALELTRAALKAGKVVVTANKALICAHGAELFAAARSQGGHYFFEASVGGGIPIIKAIREGLVANRFPRIYGILNGTCNYILTRMEREGLSYAETVGEARRLGYVEADEALDLDGFDTAHKAVILAFLAHGRWVPLKDVPVEGIRQITGDDIAYAAKLGYKIKLLGIIDRDFSRDEIFVRVHPTLISRERNLAAVDDVFNGVCVSGDISGATTLIGRGAGQDATASAVISDIADAVVALLGAPPPVISEEDAERYADLGAEVSLASPESISHPFYLRLAVLDQPGVLAEVARVLADAAISIATVIQHAGDEPGLARLILTTHASSEACMARALAALEDLAVVRQRPFLLRIADFTD